jgi:hypothetical protein
VGILGAEAEGIVIGLSKFFILIKAKYIELKQTKALGVIGVCIMIRLNLILASALLLASTVASYASASPPDDCSQTGYIVGLNPYGDNNLSVHAGPYARDTRDEIDELFTGDTVCVHGKAGPWFHVQYVRNGRAQTGWAHARYIRLD